MRTADYIGVLYRAGLVKFASQGGDARHATTRSSSQFLAGRASGPIGMDELATEETDIERELVERRGRAHARRDGRRRSPI